MPTFEGFVFEHVQLKEKMMTPGITSDTTVSGTTAGQCRQYFRFVEDAADKALTAVNLDKDSLQCLIENGGEFQKRIILAIQELSVNQFTDEEMESSFGYFPGYKPGGIVAQVNMLRELFPEIGYANQDLLAQVEKGQVAIPTGAEGWFAIPHWSKVASTYQEALEKVLVLLAKAYGDRFQNYRSGQLGSQHLRETPTKALAMERLQQCQNADIILVPAQFGLRHRGRSVRRASAVMAGNEYGLGAYEIGIMLLTHPDRLKHFNDLRINCAGDEYSPDVGHDFWFALIFSFHVDGLEFDYYHLGRTVDHEGSASGFVSQ